MADRQWLVEGVQVFEEGEEEYLVEGVQISEDQAAAAVGGSIWELNPSGTASSANVWALGP